MKTGGREPMGTTQVPLPENMQTPAIEPIIQIIILIAHLLQYTCFFKQSGKYH
jgi:hypothetical protein